MSWIVLLTGFPTPCHVQSEFLPANAAVKSLRNIDFSFILLAGVSDI